MPVVWILVALAMFCFTGKQVFLGVAGFISITALAQKLLSEGEKPLPPEKKCPPHRWRRDADDQPLYCGECKVKPSA